MKRTTVDCDICDRTDLGERYARLTMAGDANELRKVLKSKADQLDVCPECTVMLSQWLMGKRPAKRVAEPADGLTSPLVGEVGREASG